MTPFTAPGIISYDAPSFDEIRRVVCEHYGITYDQFMSRTRKQPVAFARQVAMILACELRRKKKEPLRTIGFKMARLDHSTVIHAKRVINNELFTNKKFRKELDQIKASIKGEPIIKNQLIS